LDSDIDLALFVKSEIPFEKKEEILQELRNRIPELKNIKDILLFFIDKQESGYTIKTNGEFGILSPMDIDFLFNGKFVGYTDTFQKVLNSLFIKYFDMTRLGEHRQELRSQFLRRLEYDLLLNRLLYKGFRKYYPSASISVNVPDSESCFWDSSYRYIASQLYLEGVFLPNLEIES